MYWKKTELPEFICRFLRRIFYDSTTHVELAGMTRGEFLMARCVRQGCPASFRAHLPLAPGRNHSKEACWPRLPTAGSVRVCKRPCSGSRFSNSGSNHWLNLNCRKCCWVKCGRERCESLLNRVATNCEEFREMKAVKYAMYVGTMIGLEGHAHRWTALRKIIRRVFKINSSTKSLVERLCDIKIFALSVLGKIGSMSALRPMPYSVLLQDHTMLFPPAC